MFNKKEDFLKFSIYFLYNQHNPITPFTEDLKEYLNFSKKYIRPLRLFSYCSIEFEKEFKQYDVYLYIVNDDFKNKSYHYFSTEKIENRSKDFLEELKDKYGIDYKYMKYIGNIHFDNTYFISLLELKDNFLKCF